MAKLPRGIHTEIEWLRLDFHVCMTWQSSHIIVRWNPWKSSLRHSISNRGFFKFMPLSLSAVSLSLSLSLSYISQSSHPLKFFFKYLSHLRPPLSPISGSEVQGTTGLLQIPSTPPIAKKFQPPSPLKKSQSPPAPSVANLRLRGSRHHRPAPASVNAAHRQQNQVLFCLFRLDFSFSFRFS